MKTDKILANSQLIGRVIRQEVCLKFVNSLVPGTDFGNLSENSCHHLVFKALSWIFSLK